MSENKPIQQGEEFNEPVGVEGYPRDRRVNNIWTKEDKWRIKAEKLNDFLPDISTTDEKGRTPRDVSIFPANGFGGNVLEVTIQWKYPDRESMSSIDRQAGSVIYESDTRMTEQPIENYPDWDSWTAEEQKEKKKAYPTFSVTSVVFKRSEIKDKRKFVFTEAEIVGDVNQLNAPKGLKNPSDGKWMNMGKNIRVESGNSVEVVETWQYDQNAWKGVFLPPPPKV